MRSSLGLCDNGGKSECPITRWGKRISHYSTARGGADFHLSKRKNSRMNPSHHTPQPPRLLDQVRAAIRLRHYSASTEEVYVRWARRYILFHQKRHPRDMGATEVTGFLSHLALAEQVSASTQNQAKAALLFLYKEVLGIELPWLDEVIQARHPRRIPVVLSVHEVNQLLDQMTGTMGHLAELLYGSGMRLMEGSPSGSKT